MLQPGYDLRAGPVFGGQVKLIIDHWVDQGTPAENCGTIALTAGVKRSVTLNYYENTGVAKVQLTWQSASQSKQVIPQSQLFTPEPTETPTPTNTTGPSPTASRTPTTTPTASSTATPVPTSTPSTTPGPSPTPGVPQKEVWRFYYYAGARRVAMRVEGQPDPAQSGVFYLLADHLGSKSVVVRTDGTVVGRSLYRAFGDTRLESGDSPTDYHFTGQREEAGVGLYYYNARWYDRSWGGSWRPLRGD